MEDKLLSYDEQVSEYCNKMQLRSSKAKLLFDGLQENGWALDYNEKRKVFLFRKMIKHPLSIDFGIHVEKESLFDFEYIVKKIQDEIEFIQRFSCKFDGELKAKIDSAYAALEMLIAKSLSANEDVVSLMHEHGWKIVLLTDPDKHDVIFKRPMDKHRHITPMPFRFFQIDDSINPENFIRCFEFQCIKFKNSFDSILDVFPKVTKEELEEYSNQNYELLEELKTAFLKE